jgi:hypothetical protein
MADWRQIQARIRKAKTGPDAPAKLSELYQRTRDAMVAWELGAIEEKAEHKDEAGNWYTIAAQRFRRADWKKKAEEALTRLGVALPPPPAEFGTADHAKAAPESSEASENESHEETSTLAVGEIPEASETEEASEGEESSESSPMTAESAATGDPAKRKRRRGRRGGRGRRRKGATAGSPGLPTAAFAESAEAKPPQQQVAPRAPAIERPAYERPVREQPTLFEQPRPARAAEPAAPLSLSERSTHGRAGDPALASRMAHLESMLRRLVASPLHRLEEADEAPAGPGVFLLSDSDLITSYYVEACQTLRIGCGNMARGGGRSGKNPRAGGRGYSESGLKGKLAEYLGISEAKVSQYMKDHCVLRWIQLDDEAPLLAHFAIGVLRTPLNLD